MSNKTKIQHGAEEEIIVQFKPRARLLKQLGNLLIKNESIALIELVKNSYDADANEVSIYMENIDSENDGIIIIEDDGFGMSAQIVEDVWMEPGSDFKAEKFKKRETSPIHRRLPIGEKGIGRFGVHKLGDLIEMTSKMENEKEVYVRIDWRILDEHKYLKDVLVKIIKRPTPELFKEGKTGTNIIVSKLRNKWKRRVVREVKRSINSLTSPFETNDSFKANFEILDKPDWFEGILPWKEMKEYSLFNFHIEIEGDSLTKFDYDFVPWDSMPKIEGRELTLNDRIVSKFAKLEDENENLFSLEEHQIGKVIFSGYIFERETLILKLGLNVEKKSFKDYLDSNGGVKVFRDGLRIYDYGEPENDWLDQNLRRVNNPTKVISKNIIVGAVFLSRDSSSSLIEKTNREGFVENEAYKTFKNSISKCLEMIENFRYNDKRRLKEIYGPSKKSEPVLNLLGDLKKFVDKKIKEKEVKTTITKYIIKIEADYAKINENLLKAAGAGLSLSVIVHEVEKIIIEILKVLKVEKGSERVYKLVRHLDSLIDGYADIIRKSTRTNEDLKSLIEQSLFNVEFRLESHKISVVKKFAKKNSSFKVKLAKSLLIGSLMNLIDNSIFWLEKSGKKDKKILVDIIQNKKGYVNILLVDNGTGFLLPTNEITEAFVSGKPGGMGLGLHIASEIMSAHKGRLWFPEPYDFKLSEEFQNGAIVAFEFKI